MPDILATILERAECAPPLFHADEISLWPSECMKPWLDRGLLRSTAPATALPCYGCGGGHIEEVVFLKNSHDRRAYLPCPECGPMQIDPNRLQRWEVDLGQLAQMIFDDLNCHGQVAELASQRFWRLGSTCLGGHRRNVFFGRMFNYPDGQHLLSLWRIPASGIVFVPCVLPDWNVMNNPRPMMFSLRAILQDGIETFHLDHTFLEDEFASHATDVTHKNTLSKRAERAALIVALTDELIEHLRTARDYARATERQCGNPKLLPRPTQEELAHRVGTSQGNVSRCLADESARELRMLWKMAVDLDRIMYPIK